MRTATIVITLAVSFLTGFLPSASASDSAEPGHVVRIDGSPEQEAVAKAAIARFSSAGLALPPLDIEFHHHRDGCRGHHGVFRLVAGVGEIEICRATRYVLLHELAHAWEAVNMSAATRRHVMAYWQVDNWNDRSKPAGDRGAEKVADTIAFALDGPPADPNPTLRRSLCSYPLVTGRNLPASVDVEC